MSCFLCYDIKGIQQFIHSVPQLKYVVGGSILIARFDNELADAAAQSAGLPNTAKVFAGGGRGTFKCSSRDDANRLRLELVGRAHQLGLDLRIGIDESLSEASHHADDLYPFIPDSLDGEPCRASGLWPITLESSRGFSEDGRGIHPLIWERREAAIHRDGTGNAADTLSQQIVSELRQRNLLPNDLRDRELVLLRVVRGEMHEEPALDSEAEAADVALGRRNRWAVVAMDGNDMGSQFLAMEKSEPSEEVFEQWLRRMSNAVRRCTQDAFLEALGRCITAWWDKLPAEDRREATDDNDRLVLPFRPLVLGGDDVLCISHASHAMTLAETVSERFGDLSGEEAAEAQGQGIILWPATGGQLSISAGIVYTGVTLPLYSSIHYAESLLASAKGKFRKKGEPGNPTPAAVDWENITETMLDTPAARRNRELRFKDGDLGGAEVRLTDRPYQFGEPLDKLHHLRDQLAKAPRSLLAEAMLQLRRPWAERVRWLTAVAKRNATLHKLLDESNPAKPGPSWSVTTGSGNGDIRTTSFADAVLLLEESHRMTQETVE